MTAPTSPTSGKHAYPLREDKAAAASLLLDLAPGPYQTLAGWAHGLPSQERDAIVRVARAVLVTPPAPPTVDVNMIREFIVEEVGFDHGASMTAQAERLAARLRGTNCG